MLAKLLLFFDVCKCFGKIRSAKCYFRGFLGLIIAGRGCCELQMDAYVRKLFQGIKINQFVDDGVDGQTRGRMDIQLAGDMLAVGYNRVHGDT